MIALDDEKKDEPSGKQPQAFTSTPGCARIETPLHVEWCADQLPIYEHSVTFGQRLIDRLRRQSEQSED